MSKEEVAAADALTKQLEEQPKPAEAPKNDEGNKKPTP